jgi:membrane fusion protein, multidrug efflux system
MKTRLPQFAILFIMFTFAVMGCSSKESPMPYSKMVVAITAEKAVQKTVPVMITAIGTVEAYKSVGIYSQVNGQLQKIHFAEGTDVRKGEPLFTIDPAPFKEKLKQAEQKLAQDQAQLKFYEAEAKRYAFLAEKGAASRSDYEKNQTAAATQEAIVKADRAAVEDARLQLSYCYISAPFDGRTGAHAVKEGAVIKQNDTQLAVINQIAPVNVKFSVPEKQLYEVKKYRAMGTLSVRVSPSRDFRSDVREGKLTFIDNTVNIDTGMIQMKALFPNADKFLWPGQFVNTAVILTQEPDAVVVPTRSVQISEKEKFVFVVKPDKTVEYRPVEVSRTMDEESVISKGIKAGETVVTDGQLKLRPGATVEITNSPEAQSAPGQPVKATETKS